MKKFLINKFDNEIESEKETKSIVEGKTPDSNGLYKIKVEPKVCKFYNDENNYGIYTCKDLDTEMIEKGILDEDWTSYETINIVGNMPKLILGKSYNAIAEVVYHNSFGQQFKIHSIFSLDSNNSEDEKAMLMEFVAGSIYNQIVLIYDYPLTALLNGTFDYDKIKGMGKERYESLLRKAEDSQKYIKAQSELGRYGISFNTIIDIVDRYGSSELAVEKVKKNPYVLYHDIKGIGFLKADVIARSIGFAYDCPERKVAGIVYALELEEYAGNTWGYISSVKNKVEELLKLDFSDFDEYLNNKMFYFDEKRIAMKKVYKCEEEISLQLHRLNINDNKSNIDENAIEVKVTSLEKKSKFKYTESQKRLFYEFNKNNVIILTGFAGTGKTFLMNGLLKIVQDNYFHIMLVSPTAKAAKVLSNSTGKKATTIHRALKYSFGKFEYNIDNKLKCDLMIIDEASMIDIYLFRSLLQALPDGCKVLIIGDTAQLESVAVGNVLHDIINSYCFPVISLKDVFRQALDSGILSNATKVREGRKFYQDDDSVDSYEYGVNKDFKLWFGLKEQSCERVKFIYEHAIKKWSLDDILVITPMKVGNSGVINLNRELQGISNPCSANKNEINLDKVIFREGDKVRHTKNDYQAMWYDEFYNPVIYDVGVFNGDFGIIKHITSNNEIFVDYGEKIIKYVKPYKNLDLAYAITAHSSQGSQSKVVIGVMDISHYMNLKRNLLYTLITRAQEKLFLVADKKALGIAMYNNTIPKKQTFLEEKIKDNNNLNKIC